MPVMTVIDSRITEKMTAVVKMLTQRSLNVVMASTSTIPPTARPKIRVASVRNRLRVAATGAIGGGSTPLSGSLLAVAVRSPGQKSSSRNSAANGSDGRRFCASTLAGGR